MPITLSVSKSFTNALLNRKEMELVALHAKQSTPTKDTIASELSKNYSIPKSQIFVHALRTGFGSHETVVKAHLYNSEESFKAIARSFVIRRVTGEETAVVPRRQRKDTRKKSYKMFGTLKRNMAKAAKRNKDD